MRTTLKAAITGLLMGALTINSMAAVFTYDTGTTIKFAPDSTIAGINVGSLAGDPSAPLNGDLWYDSTANELTARINGANVALGSGSGSGTAAGLVSIINDSGTTTNYNPASDTDAARGTALLAAVAAATAGQTVRVGAGTFALAANRLLIPDDVALDLDPATLITGTANLSTAGPMVRPGNRSIVRGGKIQGVAASGVSQAPFGISSFVASPDSSAVDFVLDGVTLEADSDAFYILDNGTCSGTLRNCTLISKYDIIYVSGFNGDPGTHTVRIYNTRGIVVGTSTIASPLARGTTIAYGGTVDIHGGSLAISDGGTTLNAGAAAYEGGTLNLYGVKITTSNGANPNYDLYTNGSGVIRVNGGAGSGSGGIYSTNSGANVTYIGGNLGAATATSLNGLTISTTTGTLTLANGKTLTGSNTLTLAGTDGSTLNIGAGGTLGAAALLGTSAGGNGTADNGKAAIFGTGGIFDVTTELPVHNSATAAHAYLSDDGTIGFHAVGETNPRELAFPSDVLEGESKEIATKNWVNAQGFGLSSGDVSAAANFGADNRLIRSNGTTKGVQASGITVDDSDNLTGVSAITVSGAVTAASLSVKADVLESSLFAADAGASDTYVATLSPAITSYVTGAHYRFKANTANTGAATLNLNGLGAKTIVKAAGGVTTALADNDIRAGQWVDVVYDGTNLQMQSILGNAASGSGDFVGPASSTDNAIVRFDSTTGKLGQNSTVTIDDTGAVTVPEMAAPATPAAGKVSFYAKADGLLYSKDDAGTETVVTGGGGSGSSPTTTRGDLIRRGASADERLAVGSLGQVFMTDGTDPQWRGRNKYIDIFDEFMWGSVTAAANSGFGFASSGTISLASAIEQGRPGVAIIQAGVATTDNARLNTGAASIALGGGAFRFETSIKTPAALSDATDEYDIRIGLGDAAGAFTDGVYFEYDRNASTNWVCGACKAGATTENAGGAPVAVAADTWYKLRIMVNADASQVLYYINDTLIYTNSASNIPNTTSNLCGFYFLIVKSAGTTTKSFSVDYAEAQFDLTTAR